MNDELGDELVKEVGGGKVKFFQTDVLETDSITAAVKGSLEWAKETGKEVGGVIAAAGVSTPAKVGCFFSRTLFWKDLPSLDIMQRKDSSEEGLCVLLQSHANGM